LAKAIVAVRDLRAVYRRRQLGRVGEAVARDPAVAAFAWPDAVEWASAHPRNEAIEMLALLAPVAATVGGHRANRRDLRWWGEFCTGGRDRGHPRPLAPDPLEEHPGSRSIPAREYCLEAEAVARYD
jgi:hypothetical protein